ncbi:MULTISPECIES: serine/threonine-protein kinase [Thermomonosporaceae]|uniref:serine/threonine-protein kinase n=1 Tax=Thermomonosporaceae TaxID=2012 RepID=UPI00255B3A16|nr:MULTISPECIES: serine/threonine-protein kinase [Thermomonosporaceae]MDL4773055.1 serine/threonine-protein kinase [Actinomadura xylanilytica]
MRETRPGQVIGGRYRLDGELASGGFGRVWRGWDLTLQVEVAVKEVWLHPGISAAARTEMIQRAGREAGNAAKVRDHPNIVAVHDVAVEDGVPWMIMQLVSGRSLYDEVAAHGRLDEKAAVAVARAMLKALKAAHGAGIVHRDVKPANVMLTSDGEVMLTDFGIAVQQDDLRLTGPGMFLGTPGYTAPERILGKPDQGASDLFSLGATLYYAVEGVPPFGGASLTEINNAILSDEKAPRPEHAGRLAPLIKRLMKKDPLKRPTVHQALALLDEPPAKVTGSGGAGLPPTKKLPEKKPPEKKPVQKKPVQKKPVERPKKPPETVGRAPAKETRPPTPKTETPAKKDESSDWETWATLLAGAAIVCGLLYHDNTSFAVSATEGLKLAGDASSAKSGSCLHHDTKRSMWVKVPCWSAAAERIVTSRNPGLFLRTSTSSSPCMLKSNEVKVYKATYGNSVTLCTRLK